MFNLKMPAAGRPLKVLCLGAHSDDIEIGCGGTLLEWLDQYGALDVTWVVFSAVGQRAAEAAESADRLLDRAIRKNVVLKDLRDGFFPAQFAKAKELVEEIKAGIDTDVVFTHRLEDQHQDHRIVAELTWQTFRDQLILEYEIPKYEGDLGQPNFYVPLSRASGQRKVDHLMRHFGSQRSKGWFRPETFLGLMNLRAIECRAPDAMAEAFHARKIVI